MARPFVTVNCAASIDGKISTASRERTGISDRVDSERVARLRKMHDAIAVGIGTVLSDDPSLGTAVPGEGKQAAKVVFDSNGRTPKHAKMLQGSGRKYIVTSRGCTVSIEGATMLRCGDGKVDLEEALGILGDEGMKKVLVEGGGEIIFALASLGLIDRLMVYTAPVIIGGRNAPTIADGQGFVAGHFAGFRLVSVEVAGEGVLSEYARR